jgi:hypothetical protein
MVKRHPDMCHGKNGILSWIENQLAFSPFNCLAKNGVFAVQLIFNKKLALWPFNCFA